MSLKLSRLALRDLDEIRRYTVKTWGRDQWITYYRGLVQAFESIAANPDAGRDRSLFAAGLRSVNYRRHVIFFARIAAAGDEPVILRIVHQRRNLPALVYFERMED
ncbi:MAG: type II toxin-antitoxin system RelE/ParE family toxin [Gammaproteobacteria bacterium]|nr:type II toxin-antitoxin system RelE/ParE family toxin [Gammaproteobacteria bacterium]MDE0364297.1 type II toxin-antitoxin system RelE/ParE family toxin [Gammaproteobacteria bacterium]